jgi:hypothetical protein
MIKAGARFFNSPKYAAKWVDLYSTGQRLDENAKKALQPSRQHTLQIYLIMHLKMIQMHLKFLQVILKKKM